MVTTATMSVCLVHVMSLLTGLCKPGRPGPVLSLLRFYYSHKQRHRSPPRYGQDKTKGWLIRANRDGFCFCALDMGHLVKS